MYIGTYTYIYICMGLRNMKLITPVGARRLIQRISEEHREGILEPGNNHTKQHQCNTPHPPTHTHTCIYVYAKTTFKIDRKDNYHTVRDHKSKETSTVTR